VWCFVFVLSVTAAGAQSLYDKAVIDLTSANLLEVAVALDDSWEFYPSALLTPGRFALSSGLVRMPHLWNLEKDRYEVAAYHTQVLLPPEAVNKPLAILMPDVYCSYELWVNGKLLSSNGKVSAEKRSAKPQWLPRCVSFTSPSAKVDIIINVSGHFHDRRGIGKLIYLGSDASLTPYARRTQRMEEVLFVSLIVLTLLFAMLWLRWRHTPLMFFALLCLSWAFRSAFSNNYLAVQWFHDLNWYAVVRVEYISLYLTTLFGLLFVSSLFPDDVNRTFQGFYMFFTIVFTVFTLVTEPLVFTGFVQLYLAFASLLVVTSLITLVKAFINARENVQYYIASYVFGIGLFGYVIVAYERAVELNEIVFNVGFFLLFAGTGAVLIVLTKKKVAGNR
jgi:hypothetical protein